MRDRRSWIWLSAVISAGAGLLLVLNDSAGGWILVLLGITYLGLLTRRGQAWTSAHADLARWALIGVTILVVLLAAILAAVLAPR
jgi:hypothetical protein